MMCFDANNKPLKVGDSILFMGKIVAVQMKGDIQTLHVEGDHKIKAYRIISELHPALVELLEKEN